MHIGGGKRGVNYPRRAVWYGNPRKLVCNQWLLNLTESNFSAKELLAAALKLTVGTLVAGDRRTAHELLADGWTGCH